MIIAALALSILQSVLAAAVVIGALLLLYGVLFKPKEVLTFLAFGLFSWALQNHFMAMVAMMGTLTLVALIFGRG